MRSRTAEGGYAIIRFSNKHQEANSRSLAWQPHSRARASSRCPVSTGSMHRTADGDGAAPPWKRAPWKESIGP